MQKNDEEQFVSNITLSTILIFVSVFMFEGLIGVVWLLSIPSNPGGLIFGLSLNRLLLISVPMVSLIFFLVLLVIGLFKSADFLNKIRGRFNLGISRFLLILSAILSIVSWSVLFFFNLLSFDKYQYISERSLPLVVWGIATGWTMLISLKRIFTSNHHARRAFDFKLFVPISMVILVLFSLPLATGIGLYTRDVTVNDLGIPLLEWQIIFTLGLLLILTYVQIILRDSDLFNRKTIDTIGKYLPPVFFIAIWLAAFIFWHNQPFPTNNYFAPKVLPPNFETYPFSDAERYSLDSIRIINGISSSSIISKSFHVVYLAFLNYFGNLDYQKVILGQTLILAFFPSVLFLIGKEIRGNILGLGMGIFTIFREINALQAADIANVANSKLLLSDFPSALILSLLVLFMIKWNRDPHGKFFPIIIGGILGVLILYRAQYLIFVPVFMGIAFLLFRKDFKKFILFSGVFFICLSAMVAPLLIRNHSISGIFWFDSSNYLSVFKESYVLANPENINSDYGPQDLSSSQNQSGDQPGLFQSLIRSNYLFDVPDNFFRNLISTFLIFPIRMNGSQDLQELSVIKDNFWSEANQYHSPLNLVLAVCNLVLFISGLYFLISTDWQTAISCFLIYLAQNLSSALFRFSGWRFIMPVDWMAYFIYTIGVFGIFEILGLLPVTDLKKSDREPVLSQSNLLNELKTALPFLIMFILIGSIIPIRELFPPKIQTTSKLELCATLEKRISAEKLPLIREKAVAMCADSHSTVLEGEIIYPRFFERGQGFYDNPSDVFYGKQDFSRMMFRFSTNDIMKLYIPVNMIKDNIKIPNGTPAIILAATDDLPKVQLVLLNEGKNTLLYSDELLDD